MKNVIILISLIFNFSICKAQFYIEKEIRFDFENYFNRESLKLKIELSDDGSVYGEAIHNLPAKFGGHPRLLTPDDIELMKLDEEVTITDQRELVYHLYDNEKNRLLINEWLKKITKIDFITPTITEEYMYTTDGTFGKLNLKIGENKLTLGLRNFDSFDSSSILLWISDLINEFGIDTKKLFH